jgi:hypothetical protein
MRPEEFPKLTPEAWAARDAGIEAIQSTTATISPNDLRRALAAFLREAMKQVQGVYETSPLSIVWWDQLQAIANNVHSPPPPPPTLTQARAADLDTPEGKAAVRAFLAMLGEDGQP